MKTKRKGPELSRNLPKGSQNQETGHTNNLAKQAGPVKICATCHVRFSANLP